MELEKLVIISLLVIIISSVSAGFLGARILNGDSIYIHSSIISIDKKSSCNQTDLFDRTQCLQDKLSTFYKYNESNVGKTLTLDQLKTEGGVCDHFANWYINELKDSNFYVKEVDIDIDNRTGHAFTIASNYQGYCILDQLDSHCWRLG